MDVTTMGTLRVRSFGADRQGAGGERQGADDRPAVLLCHGYGAPGDDLVALAREVDAGRDVRWFFPEAPIAMSVGFGVMGRAWWPIDMERIVRAMGRGGRASFEHEIPAGLDAARAALEGCIDELVEKHGVRRDRLVIGGFSQGAMLTCEVALHAKAPFAGLVQLSGTIVAKDRWTEALARAGKGLRVFQSHGKADPILSFTAAEGLRGMFTEAGADVSWVPHSGQHEIPRVVLEKLGVFLRGVLGT